MESWSLKKKMDALTAGMLSVMLVLSVVGIFSTWRMSEALNDVLTSSSQTRQFADVEAELLNARLSALMYRIDASDERAIDVNESIDDILAIEEALELAADQDSPKAEKLRRLKSDLIAYKDLFESLQQLQSLAFNLVDIAAFAGMEAQENLLSLLGDDQMVGRSNGIELAGLAQQEFLLSRIALERYLRTDMEESFTASADALGRSIAVLNRILEIDEFRSMAPKIEAILSDYAEFRQLGIDAYNAIAMRDDARESLLNTGDAIQTDVFDLLELITEEQEVTGARASLAANTAIVLLASLSVTCFIGAASLALRLSGQMSNAISDSIEDMNKLAQGDLDIEIRGSEQPNELGDIARALMVFRQNAIRNKELDIQNREAERQAIEAEKQREAHRQKAERQHLEDTQRARRKVLKTLSEEIGAVVDTAAEGDFRSRITATFEDIELQSMADAVNTLVNNVEIGVTATASSVNGIAEGDLTSEMSGHFRGQFAALQEDVNATIKTLARIVREISGVVSTVTEQSDLITQEAENLATQAEIQAASIEETTEAMQEVALSAQSNASTAQDASATAQSATEHADVASTIVLSTKNAMGEIHDASQQIGDIVELIDSIAFQTNILALNASVEAARAGDAGKGFAVVAAEVRALAQRTASASQNIKTLIDRCAEKVTSGVDLVDETSQSLAEIIGFVRIMSDALNGMSTTSEQQAQNVKDISVALAQLDTITQRNAQVADRGRSNARLLRDDSRRMTDLITVFRISESAPEDASDFDDSGPDHIADEASDAA